MKLLLLGLRNNQRTSLEAMIPWPVKVYINKYIILRYNWNSIDLIYAENYYNNIEDDEMVCV